jgi:predicted transcriptional regulator
MTAHDLKGLQVQKEKTKAALESARYDQKIANQKVNELQRKYDQLERQIKDLIEKCKEVGSAVVSEHALLRYFERVLGFDLNDIKAKVIPEKTAELIAKLGPGVYPVDGFKIKVKDNVVVTLVD